MVDDRPLEAAFQILGDVVRERYDSDRRTVTAALKPPLVRRTLGGFDEATLGFRSFREFVKAAADRGVVRVTPAIDSSDLEVLPAGAELPGRELDRVDRANDSPGFVRRDLWRAFLDWNSGFLRVYDKRTGNAYVVDEHPQLSEDSDARDLRGRLADSDPDLFVIEPIGADEQQRWMREFIEAVDDQHLKLVLNLALHSEKPLRAFARSVRPDQQLQARWNAMRARRVIDHIEQWMRSHGIDPVGIVEPPIHRDHGVHRGSRDIATPSLRAPGIPVAGVAADAIRNEILDAVNRMPLSDLLRLAIPAEYMLGR